MPSEFNIEKMALPASGFTEIQSVTRGTARKNSVCYTCNIPNILRVNGSWEPSPGRIGLATRMLHV